MSGVVGDGREKGKKQGECVWREWKTKREKIKQCLADYVCLCLHEMMVHSFGASHEHLTLCVWL